MSTTPTREDITKRIDELRRAMPAADFPMATEDLLFEGWPDSDYRETAAIRQVVIKMITEDTNLVGTLVQPGFKGSAPAKKRTGEINYPTWAEAAAKAGRAVKFLKEKHPRRKFTESKSLVALNNINDATFGSELRAVIQENHPLLARSPVKTQKAVNKIEGSFVSEIRTRDALLDKTTQDFVKADSRFSDQLEVSAELVRQNGTLTRQNHEYQILVQQLQEQVASLGGAPIYTPDMSAFGSTSTALQRQ